MRDLRTRNSRISFYRARQQRRRNTASSGIRLSRSCARCRFVVRMGQRLCKFQNHIRCINYPKNWNGGMALTSDTEITVLGQKVRLLQPADGGFRTSLDSVMLAAACPAKDGDHVLDLGCGVGGASFFLLYRLPTATLTAIPSHPTYFLF